MKQKTALMLIAMFGCLALGLFVARDWRTDGATDEPAMSETTNGAAGPSVATDDASTAAYLAENDRGEALQWLSDTKTPRGVARWDKDEIVGLINDFYKAGAPKVSVVDTMQVAQTEVASQFVVELPADAKLRKQIFDCDAKFEAEYDEDPTPDTGQKFLHLTTD